MDHKILKLIAREAPRIRAGKWLSLLTRRAPPARPGWFFHSFDADGLQIQGWIPIEHLKRYSEIIFKFSVRGKSVLDIGAWDGWFSFEAERLGARRVLATDHFCWSGAGRGMKDGFDYVHRHLKSRVESKDVDVFELDPGKLGKFDVVLFLGVLYHLTDPFGGLRKAAEMCGEYLVVETHTAMNEVKEPVMRYYLGAELQNDPTNFWGPNALCVEAMLKELGFTRLETQFYQTTRFIVHAWR
jgi:tRNA (mo5U34)-methyltransferase